MSRLIKIPSSRLNNYALNLVCSLAALICIGFTFHFLHMGIPWTDEASYILPSYKFLLGQTPFVDEYNPAIQLSSILTYPAFKLFYILNHHQITGLIIFSRRLLTAMAIICWLCLSRLLNAYLPFYIAILIGINIVSFVPFGLHAPFYDTLGMFFLTLGYFSQFRAIDLCSKWMFFISGIWLGLAASIYPPLGLCWFFAGFAYRYFTMERFLFYLAGLGIASSWLLVVIFHVGIPHFILAITSSRPEDYLAKTGIHGIQAAIIWYTQIFMEISPFIGALIILRLFQGKFKQTMIWQVLLILNLIGLAGWIIFKLTNPIGGGNGMVYTVALFLSAPFLYLYLYQHRLAKLLFYSVWIPSFLSCWIVAFFSASAGLSSVITAFSGVIVCLIFMAMLFSSFTHPAWLRKFSGMCLLAVVLAVAYGYQSANSNYVYAQYTNEKEFCFDHGALKDVCSSHQAGQFINEISSTLQPFSGQNKTLAVFWTIGVGYFIDDLIPFINDSYATSLDRTIEFYNRKNQSPDIIITLSPNSPFWADLPILPPLMQNVITAKYQLYAKKDYFSIYTRK